MYGNSTHNLCDTGAVPSPVGLTNQVGAVTVWILNIPKNDGDERVNIIFEKSYIRTAEQRWKYLHLIEKGCFGNWQLGTGKLLFGHTKTMKCFA